MLENILDLIRNFFSLIGVVSILTFIVTTGIKSGIQKGFDKFLQTHKSNLDKINDEYRANLQKEINSDIESLKHEQQKIIKRYELFTSKKHEKYPELHMLLEDAYGKIMGLTGWRKFKKFTDCNEKDLNTFFEIYNVTNYTQN
ncbi:hypothetical protein P9B58_02015 [Bacillus mojavensis]|uniref:hypothetical protein n=1 Tax=Bacillus mojavensis TaxID=72360 RepID=UPI002DB96F26|nr:hypothetical protein [Bacillus mojavensis]MEC1289063.1 hypothetical protein [Bacillus mojavensis]MEC1704926.1 hypothetical protein [Bacillus mojavensis]MEC5247849.1 hypothetical protein [Bacillus mojavensis]